ncbi:Antirestriction protein [Candidatus Burkholderia brachyanthoides]|nr:Antirestriction protein [Candidatus Burkholderia brachyanthoides]
MQIDVVVGLVGTEVPHEGMLFREVSVHLDESSEPCRAFYDGTTYNRGVIPYFTKEEADRLAKFQGEIFFDVAANALGALSTLDSALKEIAMEPRQSAAHKLAEQLYAAMEKGVAPWQMTWDAPHASASALRPRNYVSGHRYKGGNLFTLAMVACNNGWGGDWFTFNEAKKLGGHVRRGEKSTRSSGR